MKFLLASSNAHKEKEFNELFAGSSIVVSSSSKTLEIQENGESFQENAFKKAQGYYQVFQQPVLSDDSGLVVNALPEQLGIHSARFAPELTTYPEKCQKLIDLLKESNDRSAYFICYLCCYLNDDEVYFFEGRVKGQIAQELSGASGFGYDPVFIPEGNAEQTFASDPDWKSQNSHRRKAVDAAIKFFQNR